MSKAPSTEHLLVIEHDDCLRASLSKVFSPQKFGVDSAPDGKSGLELLRTRQYGVAIVDLSLPGTGGLETISRLGEVSPYTEIITFDVRPDVDAVYRSVGYDVFQHLEKPISPDKLAQVVNEAFDAFRTKREKENLLARLFEQRARLDKEIQLEEKALRERLNSSQLFVGQSECIRDVRRQIALVAPASMTVLISGESGSGKDVVANLIHKHSGRARCNRIIKVNCPAVPETLIESELFGHEDGAFTGATKKKPGRFDLANNGTIFLDEIGAMSLPMQAKLLQVIEHKKFTRVGGSDVVEVDARILAATNSPLNSMIKDGQFRADLFYRLNQFIISLPPLRHRREDIPLLVDFLLQRSCLKYGRDVFRFSSSLYDALVNYDWPGNVRELQAVIERFALTRDEVALQNAVRSPAESATVATSSQNLLENSEASAVLQALIKTNWNRRHAALLLGISYSGVRRRIDKYDLRNSAKSLEVGALDG